MKEESKFIHLVGWSYGGMVITGVLNQVPERIATITYLDANLPANGASAASYLGPVERFALRIASLVGFGLSPPDPGVWGIDDEDTARDMVDKLSKIPIRTLTQGVVACDPNPTGIEYELHSL